MTNQLPITELYLKKYFGYDKFRPGQREVIDSILAGKNTIAIFPTGGGKSICYQIPALILPGTTVVISPLISLMKDQVDELIERRISATYINSILSDWEVERRVKNMEEGQYKIVYIAPERFYSESFLEALSKINISFVAIDEAHCISQWGHNFRPAYLKIKDLINYVGNPVVGAFTATANKRVQEDICKLLGLSDYRIFVASFDRPNLEFKVENTEDKKRYILNYIKKNPNKSGIIYAATRGKVEELYDMLRMRGVAVGMYHAGLSNETRSRTQDAFLQDKIRVMVATNAFGMGINKSNVRYIIHYNMPKSLENYYQEAGRAGRDGKKAYCILLYSEDDYRLNRYMIEGNYPPIKLVERMYNRVRRAGARGVSQELLLRSRKIDRRTLQSCLRKLFEYNYVEVRNGIVYATLDRKMELTQEEINFHQEVEIDKLDKIREYCQGDRCLRYFILEYFNETPSFDKCGNCSVCASSILEELDEEALDNLLEGIFQMSTEPGHIDEVDEEPEEKDRDIDKGLFKRLKQLRNRISHEVGEPDSMIFDDATLERIADVKPLTKKQLLGISNVGSVQVESFGDEFIKEIHKYLYLNKDTDETEGEQI